MSKKIHDKYENDFIEYEETSDFSMYDEELEESVRESRRARREAKKRRKVKAASKAKNQTKDELPEAMPETAAVEEQTAENGNIKIKSTRQKRLKNGKKVKVASAQANEPSAKPHKKKKGCLYKLLTLVLLVLCGYGAYVGGMMLWTYFNPEVVESFPTNDILLPTNVLKTADVPDRTIALLMVTDEDKTRTDSMVLANYDNVNKKLTLVSIPRDIMVEVTDEDFAIMRSEYPEPRVDGQIMKMNHIQLRLNTHSTVMARLIQTTTAHSRVL
ncbi:MAG: LCP family protein [Firmicutes bacterium]|nr:LCP family protein [Bacillota bacterium]